MRTALLTCTTVALALTLSVAGFTKTATTHPGHAASSAALVAKGKKIASAQRCNTCHGKDYAGKPKFSPSLHASGVLKEYNTKTWAVVMNTGVTNDGGKVKAPMPVYKMKPADSLALYTYFKTLK